jgi:tetratricopeptide (TPR) repeat protein
MGGVGKTQLALKYSHDFRDEYAGVWWFRAEDLGRLQQDCQQFCERCGVQVFTGEEHHQAVKRWLQGQPRWLLVYDNAEAQYGEQKESLHPFLPGGDHHVLITSRNNCWDGLAKPIELDVWDEEQALEFLRKRLVKATDGELRALCTALGGLPLALEQACAYIIKVGVSVDGYCKALEDWEKGEKLLDRKDSLATGYSHSVLATLSLAFGRLSQAARELLRLCAWCAAEPIPESVFRGGVSFLPETLGGIVADELRWREVVAELSGYALVQVVVVDLTPNGAAERVTEQALLLHRLTQEAIRRRVSEPEKDSGVVVELLCAAYPNDPMYPQQWPSCAVLMPHVLGLETFCVEGGWIKPERYAWLLHGAAGYVLYSSVGMYRDATKMLQRALEMVKDKYGEEHHDTLAIKNNIALTYKRQGDFETALQLEKQVYDIRIRTLGNEHNDTLASLNSIAETLWELGDNRGARALEEEALETRRRILGEGHPDVLFSMHNLAVTLSDLGDYSGARELEEKALEIYLRLYGEEHPETLRAYKNISMTLKAQGDFSSARGLLEETLPTCRKVFGLKHHDTSIPAFNLFALYMDLGLVEEARILYHSDLAWILECEPSGLGDYQQRIQGWLRELFVQYPDFI